MYCIVDIETTGSYAAAGGITEISIFVHDGKAVVKHFSTLVNPLRKVPPYITALTGISNAMIASAPVFDEIADMVFDLLQKNIFVAHNVNFDHSFIKNQLAQSGYDLQVKKLCTVRLSRKIFTGLPSYSLGKLCRSLNIPIEDRHRADGDAKATVLLFEKILQANGQTAIDEMLKKSSGDQWLPLHISKQMINDLPANPGVYYFMDEKGKVLYVGKAINIKKRVSSHFTSSDSGMRRQQFLRLIYKIRFEICTNELHALVLESTEIKRLWPKYNYSQKEPLQKYALYHFTDRAGYERLAIDKKKKNLPAICVFNLRSDGLNLLKRLITDFDLHPRLCFVDNSTWKNEEAEEYPAPVQYNLQVTAALKKLDENLPTFAIMDRVVKENKWLCLLMERGSFWGMGYVSSNMKTATLSHLKETLQPYADNNFIRNSIYNYAETYPGKKILFAT